MPPAKKTEAEKAETRRAQNARYRERKKAQGLKQISFWVPTELIGKICGVFCKDDTVAFWTGREWKQRKVTINKTGE